MPIGNHKNLLIWQRSFKLTAQIYKLTAQYPRSELYGLVSQTRRCAVSIPANIAEGFTRKSRKEFIQFLFIALGSGAEMETHLLIAEELGYMKSDEICPILKELEEIMRMINSLIKKLKTSD
ncbi:MAG: S23 ribosomal protein [Parcubacteria group bacterium Gr01-1014_33]|nr:MAG: S23 ribosomal protein [Parcubacteria group bacterium Gr01-1014_33]